MIGELRIFLINSLGVGFGPWGRDFYPYFSWEKKFKSFPIGVRFRKFEVGFNLYLMRPMKPIRNFPAKYFAISIANFVTKIAVERGVRN